MCAVIGSVCMQHVPTLPFFVYLFTRGGDVLLAVKLKMQCQVVQYSTTD